MFNYPLIGYYNIYNIFHTRTIILSTYTRFRCLAATIGVLAHLWLFALPGSSGCLCCQALLVVCAASHFWLLALLGPLYKLTAYNAIIEIKT